MEHRLKIMLLLLFAVFSLTIGNPLTVEENDELQKDCGKTYMKTRLPRSINTRATTRNEAPFTVLLHLSVIDGTVEERLAARRTFPYYTTWEKCAGTVISRRHILTAARCIAYFYCNVSDPHAQPVPYFEKDDSLRPYSSKLNYFFVTAPTVCQEKCDSVLKETIVKPKRAFFSMEYVNRMCRKETEMRGDVAVIELEEDLPFTETVQPACLYPRKIEEHSLLSMYSYGISNDVDSRTGGIMRKHLTKAMTKEECVNHKMLAGLNITRQQKEAFFLKDDLCTGDKKSMPCKDDGGAGLVLRDEKLTYVAAVALGGQACSPEKDPADLIVLNQHIYHHMDWICLVSGVCPRGYLTEEQKSKMEKAYYTMKATDNFTLEPVV